MDVSYINLVRFKYTDSSCHFLELNYRGYNLNFLKVKQLLIDADIESNPGPTQNHCKSAVDAQTKLKCLKEQQKSVILVKTILLVLVVQWYRIVFSIQFNQSA